MKVHESDRVSPGNIDTEKTNPLSTETGPAVAMTNYWQYVRGSDVDCTLHEEQQSIDLKPGDVFDAGSKRWLKCGYYSAVAHTAAQAPDGTRKVISHVEKVFLVRRGTEDEQQAIADAPNS